MYHIFCHFPFKYVNMGRLWNVVNMKMRVPQICLSLATSYSTSYLGSWVITYPENTKPATQSSSVYHASFLTVFSPNFSSSFSRPTILSNLSTQINCCQESRRPTSRFCHINILGRSWVHFSPFLDASLAVKKTQVVKRILPLLHNVYSKHINARRQTYMYYEWTF